LKSPELSEFLSSSSEVQPQLEHWYAVSWLKSHLFDMAKFWRYTAPVPFDTTVHLWHLWFLCAVY